MEFIINHRKWTITELPQKNIKQMQNERKAKEEENINNVEERYYGITYTDMQEIYLDKDLPEDRKKATLIHELTHCFIVNYITHLEKQYCEEDVCDIVSNSYDFVHEITEKYFNQNKEAIKVICSALEK